MGRRLGLWACLLFYLCALLPIVQASRPALFCKCSWKHNSSIIALNVAETDSSSSTRNVHTCADCHRNACKDYHFKWTLEPGFKEEEVVTTCFQRDSAKDQAVVYTFILVTVGLLIYAGVRPWVENKRSDSTQDRGHYAAVPSGQTLQ